MRTTDILSALMLLVHSYTFIYLTDPKMEFHFQLRLLTDIYYCTDTTSDPLPAMVVGWLACSPPRPVDRRFKPRSIKTKDNNICICCFTTYLDEGTQTGSLEIRIMHPIRVRGCPVWICGLAYNDSKCDDVYLNVSSAFA